MLWKHDHQFERYASKRYESRINNYRSMTVKWPPIAHYPRISMTKRSLSRTSTSTSTVITLLTLLPQFEGSLTLGVVLIPFLIASLYLLLSEKYHYFKCLIETHISHFLYPCNCFGLVWFGLCTDSKCVENISKRGEKCSKCGEGSRNCL